MNTSEKHYDAERAKRLEAAQMEREKKDAEKALLDNLKDDINKFLWTRLPDDVKLNKLRESQA